MLQYLHANLFSISIFVLVTGTECDGLIIGTAWDRLVIGTAGGNDREIFGNVLILNEAEFESVSTCECVDGEGVKCVVGKFTVEFGEDKLVNNSAG